MWRAAVADDDLRRVAFDYTFDDSSWETVAVPGNWRATAAFANSDGPVVYRTRFDWDAGPNDARSWIVLDGVAYQGDVWFDGGYLGDSEGYFVSHAYDVTDLARLTTSHTLAIEVACPSARAGQTPRSLMGALCDATIVGSDANAGGLLGPVRVERTGPVRIDRIAVLCAEASQQRASIEVRLILDSDRTRSVRLRTRLDQRIEREQTRTLAGGRNEVTYTFGIDDPDLWWPWSLGAQTFSNVTVEVFTDESLSHAVSRRTGIRQVAFDDFVFAINGERIFAKGIGLAPASAHLANVDPVRVRRDVELARQAGLDLIRVSAHVAPSVLYDAADEAGMLVWQDLPLRGEQVRAVRRQAIRQATEMVFALGHHPSIALWCGHDAPVPTEPTEFAPRSIARHAIGQMLPSWNRSVLDAWVRGALKSADPSRPNLAHSGVLPHPPQLQGTDTHLTFGWRHGQVTDIARLASTVPRSVRWVTGLAVPSASAALPGPIRWPDTDALLRLPGYDREAFDAQVAPVAYRSYQAWVSATQDYQATTLDTAIRLLRRLKYRPTGGFTVAQLADAAPMISPSLVDAAGIAKPAMLALIEACRPVIVTIDPVPAVMHPGEFHGFDIHVVSDLRVPLRGIRVEAAWTLAGHVVHREWTGDLEPDSVERVGEVLIDVPDRPGQIEIVVRLSAGPHSSQVIAIARVQRL